MVHCGNASSMAKVGSNGEVYAVLMEGNAKEAEEAAVPLHPARKSVRPEGSCHRVPHCLGWALLLAVTTTCITVLAFQMWATWHLQQKVLILQAQVDSISALDLEELRSQLRDLYDLRDLSSSDRDSDIEAAGLRGHPTSADEDQEDDPYAEHLMAGFASVGGGNVASDGEQVAEKTEADDESVEMDDTVSDEEEDDEENDESGEEVDDEDENQTVKSQARQQAEKAGRSRRQADLSSHTQDGVPIFDRGYGISLNRTEGLRIYQSLLATGGRGEPRSPDVNWDVTDTPIQPHHRQNSFWRGKKEKPRHQPLKPTTVPSAEPISESIRSSTASPVRAPVEFRHSRVKSSGEVTSSTPSPVQGDQKSWQAARPANAIPEDKSAAKPVHRGRQPAGVFKVSQPALVSRYAAGVQATADKDDRRNSEETSVANHAKKRVNKKQLREAPHLTTAIHLVADSRNESSVLDNQVEVASRNELGLHTSWKLASWHSAHRTSSLVRIDGATLTIKQNGLYLIYAQVHYLDEHAVNAYEIFVNTEPFLRCVTTSHPSDVQVSLTSSPKANTCYTSGATHLREGDKLFLRDIEPMRYSVLQPSKTFFGLIRLGPIAEFP